jgi:hypothetical protein
MAGFVKRSPGGVWHTVNSKALSYSFITGGANGFGGAMFSTSRCGGSILHQNLLGKVPMALSARAADNAPYMRIMPHMTGGGFMNVLKLIGSNIIGPVKDFAETLFGR